MSALPKPALQRMPIGMLVAAMLAVAAAAIRPASAATTDIAAEPVIARAKVSAKPNLMFVLDDSGSMASAYMPDEMSDAGTYGYWSAQCNGVAFDPASNYPPPLDGQGGSFAAANFLAAKSNGYDAGSATKDLTGSSYYVYDQTGGSAQKRMDWTYAASGGVDRSTTFYLECMSPIGKLPGSRKFTRVIVDGSTPAELRSRYANWYSYYRTRSLMMRTTVGRAVGSIDANYRVGFSRINSKGIVDGVDFRDAKDFDRTQRANFYSSLYSAEPGGGTPLRGALSKIGRYYAKKIPGQGYDPVQYACQRNYALLSTDGYWNSGGRGSEDANYGPLDLNGALVGNQDADEVRPMYDGGTSVRTDKTPLTTVTRKQNVVVERTVTTFRRDLVALTSGSGSCKANEVRQSVTPQTRTTTTATQTTSVVVETATVISSVVTTNGKQAPATTSAPTVTTTVESSGSPVALPPTATDRVDGPTVSSCVRSNRARPPGPTAETSSSATSSSTSTTTLGITGPTAGPVTTTRTSSGGSSNTLSDVAEYYFITDLRNPDLGNCTSVTSGRDVCEDIVPTGGRDDRRTQHMTTFTLGLGTNGTLAFDKDYLNQTQVGDYAELSGTALSKVLQNWPPTTTTITGSSGDARNIDDLWHAAVNGRGQYYSARDTDTLNDAITSIINSIREAQGAGAAASFNSLSFTPGEANQVFQASYATIAWTGDVKAFTVDASNGDVTSTLQWSAQQRLDAMAWTDRAIYYSPTPGVRRNFTYANLSADGLGAGFAGFCSKTPTPAQCASLGKASPDLRPLADNGTNLVDYLRGDRRNYSTSATSPLFRERSHLLGDIINAVPVFVGKPPFKYTDSGYPEFVSANSARLPVVYAGGNDGMLHAFSAETGAELWSFVPNTVMAGMYQLADTAYPGRHRAFVDGELVVGDVKTSDGWKTILVGGLGLGGKAFYAIDVTNPKNPVPLWEYSVTREPTLGYSFGNPIITKRSDGTWIVALTSGYNNADGKGHLYILDAHSGARMADIATTAGDSVTPSGLTKINAWIDASNDNTSKRFYGGDQLGNLWRFDIDGLVQPHGKALLLAQLKTPDGAAQPVTTRPETLLVSGKYPVVVVGTGRYLGDQDISDFAQQSVYLVKDSLTDTGVGVIRGNVKLVKHKLTVSGNSSTSSTEAIDWAVNDGWWFDLPNSGERIVSPMAFVAGTLFIPSAVPSGDVCTSGGSSWLYRVDVTSGLSADPIGTLFSATSLIVGITGGTAADGTRSVYLRDSTGELTKRKAGDIKNPPPKPPRRTSWRELTK